MFNAWKRHASHLLQVSSENRKKKRRDRNARREIKGRNALIRMLRALEMIWHPLLLLDQNITLYWNVLGVCGVLLQSNYRKSSFKNIQLLIFQIEKYPCYIKPHIK